MNFSKRCGVTLEEMVAHMSRNFSLDWSSGSVVDVIAAKGVDRRIGARPGRRLVVVMDWLLKLLKKPSSATSIVNEGTEQLQSGCIDYLVRTLKHQIIYISNSTQSPHM